MYDSIEQKLLFFDNIYFIFLKITFMNRITNFRISCILGGPGEFVQGVLALGVLGSIMGLDSRGPGTQ